MESLPVFVADWEMQCCAAPFSLGTVVRWNLQFLYEDEVAAPAEALLPADSTVTQAVTATVADPAAVTGLRGSLLATWHPSGHEAGRAPVTGTVRRIRLVRQFTVRNGHHEAPVRDGAQLAELTESRVHFARGTDDSGEELWVETGLLVDLDTDLGDVIAAVSG